MPSATLDFQKLCRHFNLKGNFISGAPYGNGHINDTYLLQMNNGGRIESWILQRINHNVFKNPAKVMDNIARVTQHIRKKLEDSNEPDVNRKVLTCMPASDGKYYYQDEAGSYWRAYIFIREAVSHDICSGPELAQEAARSFGRFQKLLSDFPAASLHETIPWFHHTPRRLATLEEAIKTDSAGRCTLAKPEIDFVMARRKLTVAITDPLENGIIKPRVTHNDTKMNNVMIDSKTGKGICVIDLDTVMPGSVLYDVGDLIRSSAITTAEDQQDLSKVDMDISRFEAVIRGYSETAGEFLAPVERDLLAMCGRVITFTIGIRFLTDYLSGDVYFKTNRPNHNLDRTRVQLKMVSKMEENYGAMQKIVTQHCR